MKKQIDKIKEETMILNLYSIYKCTFIFLLNYDDDDDDDDCRLLISLLIKLYRDKKLIFKIVLDLFSYIYIYVIVIKTNEIILYLYIELGSLRIFFISEFYLVNSYCFNSINYT